MNLHSVSSAVKNEFQRGKTKVGKNAKSFKIDIFANS